MTKFGSKEFSSKKDIEDPFSRYCRIFSGKHSVSLVLAKEDIRRKEAGSSGGVRDPSPSFLPSASSSPLVQRHLVSSIPFGVPNRQ